ncbi:hypothetical protein KC887_06135 [Candidatus Kaiserbacteria bacterium]|nr:hypothetical protein [Candidatus Kaiserbacteria bacterium]
MATIEGASRFDPELTFNTIEALKTQKNLDERGVCGELIIDAEREVVKCRNEWVARGRGDLYRDIFSKVYGE